MRKAKRQFGGSLVEILIVMGIASLILVSVAYMIRSSVDYYFYSTEQIDVQRSSLLALQILTKELSASTMHSVATHAPGEPTPGLIFASAQNGSGVVQRDNSGNFVWTRLHCYYVEERPGVERDLLVRKIQDLASPDVVPPNPIALGFGVPHFEGATLEQRVMAGGISDMAIEKLSDTIRVTITAKIEKGRNKLEMDLETTILPRN